MEMCSYEFNKNELIVSLINWFVKFRVEKSKILIDPQFGKMILDRTVEISSTRDRWLSEVAKRELRERYCGSPFWEKLKDTSAICN